MLSRQKNCKGRCTLRGPSTDDDKVYNTTDDKACAPPESNDGEPTIEPKTTSTTIPSDVVLVEDLMNEETQEESGSDSGSIQWSLDEIDPDMHAEMLPRNIDVG
eukprot:3082695-Amphidinium_carterae.1